MRMVLVAAACAAFCDIAAYAAVEQELRVVDGTHVCDFTYDVAADIYTCTGHCGNLVVQSLSTNQTFSAQGSVGDWSLDLTA